MPACISPTVTAEMYSDSSGALWIQAITPWWGFRLRGSISRLDWSVPGHSGRGSVDLAEGKLLI